MELWRFSNPPDLSCLNDLYQIISTFKYFKNHRIWFCDYDITADVLLFPGLSPKTPKRQLHGWFSAQKDVLLMRGSLKWASNFQNSKIAFYGLGSASACNYTRISSHVSDSSLSQSCDRSYVSQKTKSKTCGQLSCSCSKECLLNLGVRVGLDLASYKTDRSSGQVIYPAPGKQITTHLIKM